MTTLSSSASPVTVEMILAAQKALEPIVLRTPLQYQPRLSRLYDSRIYLKREDLQIARSYKIRGAYYLISTLPQEQRERGVVCASAGNHAQGVAYTCQQLEIKGHIYMPQNTPKQKLDRVAALGGSWINISLVGDTYDDTFHAASAFAAETQKVFVPPFDDPRIIAGQGTIGAELSQQLESAPDLVVVPVGGGGLISGLAVYCEQFFPKTQLIGAEPAGAACMIAALVAGHPVTLPQIDTFVDGAAVRTAGQLNLEICRRLIREVLPVTEGRICTEMIGLYQNEGIIAEPAGALSIAALGLLGERLRDKTVVCVLSGGNNDITRYPEIIERSLIDRGLKHYFLIEFSQRPGALRQYLDCALGPDDDITLFEYIKKSSREYGPALVGIELSHSEDIGPLLARMEEIGLRYETISPESALFRFVV